MSGMTYAPGTVYTGTSHSCISLCLYNMGDDWHNSLELCVSYSRALWFWNKTLSPASYDQVWSE